jgi:hypothetical protein
MSAYHKVVMTDPISITYGQAARLLNAITALPHGPRRERFFRFFLRTDGPVHIEQVLRRIGITVLEGTHD